MRLVLLKEDEPQQLWEMKNCDNVPRENDDDDDDAADVAVGACAILNRCCRVARLV